jgi:5-methylcytosine-specific restriction endonuclease McrA
MNDTPESAIWRRRYEEHLRSSQWQSIREIKIDSVGDRCERCGNDYLQLEVHHRHYRTLGREQLEDLEVLCKKCHEDEHLLRRARAFNKAISASR